MPKLAWSGRGRLSPKRLLLDLNTPCCTRLAATSVVGAAMGAAACASKESGGTISNVPGPGASIPSGPSISSNIPWLKRCDVDPKMPLRPTPALWLMPLVMVPIDEPERYAPGPGTLLVGTLVGAMHGRVAVPPKPMGSSTSIFRGCLLNAVRFSPYVPGPGASWYEGVEKGMSILRAHPLRSARVPKPCILLLLALYFSSTADVVYGL